MARTRGASNVIHTDDGELLDKEGKPIPTGAATWTGVSQQPNPVLAEALELAPPFPDLPQDPEPARYRCDVKTVQRDMDGFEAFRLLDIVLGGLAHELTAEDFGALPADVRRHFRRVV